MNVVRFYLLLAVAAAALALLEFGGVAPGRGALLVTLVFWTAIAQGSVAVVAVTDLTGARWTGSLRRELLAASALLPFLTLLFLLLWPLLDLYPWAAAPTSWLTPRSSWPATWSCSPPLPARHTLRPQLPAAGPRQALASPSSTSSSSSPARAWSPSTGSCPSAIHG